MPIRVTFDISDEDLARFRELIRKARASADQRPEAAIVEAARKLARQMRMRELPQFVVERVYSLDLLTRMLEDEDWNLEGAHRARVVQALAYFAEPTDLIPDQLPALGFLDDAIMVELVVQDLRPEIEAYDDFCRFREAQRAYAGVDPEVLRKRLETRRRTAYTRIERRREQRERRGGNFSIWSMS